MDDDEPIAPFKWLIRGVLRIRVWDEADIATIAVGLGLCALATLVLLVYLFLRWGREGRRHLEKERRSKADRPFWIFTLWLSSMIWILSTMILCGNLRLGTLDLWENDIVWGEGRWWWLMIKWLGQVTLGWSLFFCLVLYRVIRILLRLSRPKDRPKGRYIWLACWTPTVLAAVIVVISQPHIWIGQSVHEFRQSYGANISNVVVQSLYLFVALVVTLRVQHISRAYHEMRRYTIHLSTLASFTILEGMLQLSPWRESFWLLRSMPWLVYLLVLVNLGHVYVLVLRSKRQPTIQEPVDPDADDSEVSSHLESLTNLNNPNAKLYWHPARRRESDREWLPDYEAWRAGLEPAELEQVGPSFTFPVEMPKATVDGRDLQVIEAILKR